MNPPQFFFGNGNAENLQQGGMVFSVGGTYTLDLPFR